MKIVGKRFEEIVRHRPVGNDLFDLDSDGLRFKHSDYNRQSAVSIRFT
jgi:hypothetical protein